MAAVHARNIADTTGAELVAVAGGSGAEALAARHGAGVLPVDAAFASAEIDAVVIASPNSLHVDHILGATAGGKAVLVEKPIDLDLARVDACLETVGAASDRVVVAFNRRFDPSFAAARARVVAGQLGGITQLVMVSRDPAPPPLEYVPGSGGIFRDMTIHDLDLARYFVGDVVAVQAATQVVDPAIAELGDATGAIVTLTARSGALVTIVNSRSNASGYDQRLEAFGPLGTVSSATPARRRWILRQRRRGCGRSVHLALWRPVSDAYRAEIAHLVAVTRGDDAPRATLQDGREALVLANAAAESAGTGALVRIA